VGKVKIAGKVIGDGEPCYISLEPGATHIGIDSAKELLKAVAECGADAVKFQTFLTGDADRMMGRKDIMVDFLTPLAKHVKVSMRHLNEESYPEKNGLSWLTTARNWALLSLRLPIF